MTDFVLRNGGNITNLDQHVDHSERHFYMRMEWDLDGFSIPVDKIDEYFATLVANKLNMSWDIHFMDRRPRVAVFVSRYGHCLYDILSRFESQEWAIDIPMIISNHDKFQDLAERFNIPFHHIPITRKTKVEQEKAQLELLRRKHIDLIVLARYMQILSPEFTAQYADRIINIHHSTLPAFAGANPYGAAFARGVKFIGATSHYVTEDLDAGPIIAQDVIPISHRDSIHDMKRKGRDIEKVVLAKAVFAHINHKVLSYKNKTVVFE